MRRLAAKGFHGFLRFLRFHGFRFHGFRFHGFWVHGFWFRLGVRRRLIDGVVVYRKQLKLVKQTIRNILNESEPGVMADP